MCTRARFAVGVALAMGLQCLVLSLSFAHAQAAQGDTTVPLHGVVLDAVTGKGIGRALVTSADRRLATLTDSKGQFSFQIGMATGLQYGIALSAERPGYDRMDPFEMQLEDKLATRTVELHLTPFASITGHVYAPGTNFPRGIPVTLLKRTIQNGSLTWLPATELVTDRSGAFHFHDLQSGEYVVMTQEWQGEAPLSFDLRSTTTQYPPVFLGDASTLKSATPLLLHAGETANAELHLHSATYYPVIVPITGQPQGLSVLLGDGLTSGYGLGYMPSDHAVEGWLPSGTYDLHLLSQAAPESIASAELSIHVANAPLHTSPLTLALAGNLTVRVHLELTSSISPTQVALNVQLQPDVTGLRFVGADGKPGESEFTLNGVLPGRYQVLSVPTQGYVSRITSGATDLQEQSLSVSGSGKLEPVDVTIRDDGATLSGNLQTGGEALPSQCFLVLLPERGNRPTPTAFAFFHGGAFTVANIPPGTYRLFALSSAHRNFPYRNPQAMLPWLEKGKLITLLPGAKANAEVPLVTPPDEAGGSPDVGGVQ